jgi:DegV family protein with EDD domain
MSDIAVITDTGTGLPEEWIEEYGVRTLPFKVIMGDESFLDMVDLTADQLYSLLPDADPMPTTSAPTPAEWEQSYREAIRKGAKGIIVLPLSSRLSMSHDTAQLGARSISEVPIRVVDSRRGAMAQGFVVLAAARAAQRGESLDAVVAAAEKAIDSSGFIFAINTLEYLHRGGRVPVIAAMAGSVLKVHPIMALRDDGTAGILTATRGITKSLHRILSELEKRLEGRELREAAVMHGEVPDLATDLRNMVLDRYKIDPIPITRMTAVMGVHTGPGIVGVAYRSGD